jgi:hypothetical protein
MADEKVMVVDKAFLDNSTCASDNCTHDHSSLFLSGDCHLGYPVHVRYVKATGQLEITCAKCDSDIVFIQLEGGSVEKPPAA